MLRRAWEGQAIDIESGQDLALALVRCGQWNPDIFVIGNSTGAIGPLDFVRTLRRAGAAVPVVIGMTDPFDTRELLAAGATEMLCRPLSAEAILRLLNATSPIGSFRMKPLPIDLGRLRVDGTATRMWVDGDEHLIPAMEHLLLRYLAERHGQIVSRDELVSAAWGQSGAMMSNSLAVHLGRVRRRFQAHSGDDWIRSIRGCGYQLIVPVGIRATRSAVDR